MTYGLLYIEFIIFKCLTDFNRKKFLCVNNQIVVIAKGNKL